MPLLTLGRCGNRLCLLYVSHPVTQGIVPTRLHSRNKDVTDINKEEYCALPGREVGW
jgi:hypothetical protein